MDVFSSLNFKNCGLVLDYQTVFPSNPNNGQMELVNGVVYIWTSIDGITTWYPLTSETSYYIHFQGTESTSWLIQHNLSSTDYIFFVYDDNDNLVDPIYEYVNTNSFKLNFTVAKKGKAVVFVARNTVQSPNNQAGAITVMRTASNYTASSDELVVCTTKGSTLNAGETAFTVTLPSSPNDKDIVYLMDGSDNAQDRPIKISASGKGIINPGDDFICDVNRFKVTLVFDSVENTWSLAN